MSAEIIAAVGAFTSVGLMAAALFTSVKAAKKVNAESRKMTFETGKINGEIRSLLLADMTVVNKALVEELTRVGKARDAFESQIGESGKRFEDRLAELAAANQVLQTEVARLGTLNTVLQQKLDTSEGKADALQEQLAEKAGG
jgi:hypothetical protein